MRSKPENVQATLPLAARDALAMLLLDDLAASQGDGGDAVAAARSLLDVAPGAHLAAGSRAAEARAGAALRRAGLAREQKGGSAEPEACVLVRTDPAWSAIAADRLAAYAAALRVVERGHSLPARLAQACTLFDRELYFEVHEVLEPAWRSATGSERRTLQGLIQTAVAWYHASLGNVAAARRLAAAAGEKLAGAPDPWSGFAIATFRKALGDLQTRLGNSGGALVS